MNTKLLTIVRCILSFTSVAGLVMTSVFGNLATNELVKAGYNKTSIKERLHWNATEPGYSDHLGSAFCEWIMVFAMLFFFASYYTEFKTLDTKVHIKCKVSNQASIVPAQQSVCT